MSEENKTLADVKQGLLDRIDMSLDSSFALSYKLLCEAEQIEQRTKQEAEHHPIQMEQLRNPGIGTLTAQGQAQMQAASQE